MYFFSCSAWFWFVVFFFFFFNDTATTEIYTLSLHDALPICRLWCNCDGWSRRICAGRRDRKSTRLNSSHQIISYAVFCLKKKKKTNYHNTFIEDHTGPPQSNTHWLRP